MSMFFMIGIFSSRGWKTRRCVNTKNAGVFAPAFFVVYYGKKRILSGCSLGF